MMDWQLPVVEVWSRRSLAYALTLLLFLASGQTALPAVAASNSCEAHLAAEPGMGADNPGAAAITGETPGADVSQSPAGGAPSYSQPPYVGQAYVPGPPAQAPAGWQYGTAAAGGYNWQYGSSLYTPLPWRQTYTPSGLVIPVTLSTSISTQVARAGDYVQAQVSRNIPLGGLAYIPAGSQLTGQITEAEAGRFFQRSGSLGIEFNSMRLPDGTAVPLQAHILGGIGRYQDKNGVYRGEGWGAKLENFAWRGALGAGGGALFGTAVGAIAGGVGRGAWSGTAIGGGLGILDDLVLRKGRNVLIHAGTPMQIQLDEPLELPLPQAVPGQTAEGSI